MIGDESAAERLRTTIMRDRERIARGERPTYHVTWAFGVDAVDVRIAELPLVHLFVPDEHGVADGARVMVARTLGVAPTAFDLQVGSLRPPERAHRPRRGRPPGA